MPIIDCPLIAHRGASMAAPENTLAAVECAARKGALWVETDVRLTADGGLAIIHDTTLDRTTNGTGAVARTQLSDVTSLDAGSWFDPAFSGERVPDLRSFLTAILDHGLNLQLEMKENPGLEEPLVEAVQAELEATWPMAEGRLFLSSFSERCMRLASDALPQIPRALATEFIPRNAARRLAEARCQILHVQAALAAPEALSALKAQGIEVAVATVNDAETARALLKNGATTVLSDIPDLLD